MLKRNQVLTVMSVAIVSFLIVTMFGTSFARDGGRSPINEILEIVLRLESKVDALNDLLMEGEEWEHGSVYTEYVYDPFIPVPPAVPVDVWSYTAPEDNPKKVSFWLDLREMEDDDQIHFDVMYAVEPTVETRVDSLTWFFQYKQDSPAELILDQVPVATSVKIRLWHFGTGIGADWEPITIYWQAIIEEL